MNESSIDRALGFILALRPIRRAFAFGASSEPFVMFLREKGVEVCWDKDGDDPSAIGDASDDLCVCINYCDYLTPAKSDQWIDFLSANFSLILFESGVPSKRRPREKADQVQDYWASMFELRGCSLVRGFGQSNRMPFLFHSAGADRNDHGMPWPTDSASFNWRKTFETRIVHRVPSHETRRGLDTAGQTRKVAAAVVTFNPNPDQLEHIRRLANTFDAVVVADNSEPGHNPIPGVEWVAMGGNKGVGAALNAACRRAKELGYEWLLTLDQDADIHESSLRLYLAAFNAYDDKDRTAIIAPGASPRDPEKPGGDIRDLDVVMTSGCLTNLDVWKRIGGYTEELFIDGVDHDFCLNARTHGYRVVAISNVRMLHQPGRLKSVVTFRGSPAILSWHPPHRLYYMARNFFNLRGRYGRLHPDVVTRQRRDLVEKFKQHLLYHPNRLRSALAIMRGAFHGALGRFGK
jgi:rhamnosyltransferase